MVTVSYRDTLLRYYLVYIGVVRYQLLQWKLLFCNGIPTRDINFNMSRAKVGALIFLSAGESFCFADFLCRRLCPEISQKGGKFRVAHPRCQMSQVLHGCITIGTRLKHEAHKIEMALFNCKVQGCRPIVRSRLVFVCPSLHQEAGNIEIALFNCKVQGCRPIVRSRLVFVCPSPPPRSRQYRDCPVQLQGARVSTHCPF